MPEFPSVEWFEAVRSVYNSDDLFQVVGGDSCNARCGVVVEADIFILEFEGFECSGSSRGTQDDLVHVDFYLDMELQAWQDMLVNVKENGNADLSHTLNSLDMERTPDGLAKSPTDGGQGLDLFFTHNRVFQNYFDASSRIETDFR